LQLLLGGKLRDGSNLEDEHYRYWFTLGSIGFSGGFGALSWVIGGTMRPYLTTCDRERSILLILVSRRDV
jgi:hypothetical protein